MFQASSFKLQDLVEVKAHARHIRMAPRKVRLVADLIRGKNIAQALAALQFTSRGATVPVAKLLKSAMANAKNNFKLETDTLYVKRITVDGGPTLKRWRPRAFGRAGMIRKRTSHITIILEQK